MAIVGHSQGGIVAAALASDLKDSYAIDHVVTAGSPVANHPIPPQDLGDQHTRSRTSSSPRSMAAATLRPNNGSP